MSGRSERSVRGLRSGSTRVRLEAVREFLQHVGPADEVLLVGATRGAVDDFARDLSFSRGVTFGIHRLSLTQVAARLALGDLAARGRTPITGLGYEALVSRATFDAAAEDALRYLTPVLSAPGFPRALAATLNELRLHGARPHNLVGLSRSGPDLAVLLERVEHLLEEARATDRAALFEAAIGRLAATREFERMPIVLLDVPFESDVTRRFLTALVRHAGRALITLPAGDAAAGHALEHAEIPIDDRDDHGDTDLTRLHQHLFLDAPPSQRTQTGELVWLSAPGEARECLEIARRILKEAGRGIRFDEMAILLRSPQAYLGLLEHALDRAGIAAYFDHGTRRPDPGGRAFLALLACAAENLSVARFAEYLSLGQVPLDSGESGEDTWVIPHDEGVGLIVPDDEAALTDADERAPTREDAPGLATPWRWERLLVESAVIGGADRWQRRLNGLAEEFRTRIRAIEDDDPDDARIDALSRQLDTLIQLQAFALPIVREMHAWPKAARWGEWLAHLEPFARRVLKQPDRVLRVLAALFPMSEIGPVGIAEIRDVLAERLRSLYDPPRKPRYGKVFVASTDEARGRVFKIVFLPGLAERLFPRPIHEDPLLVDELRGDLPGGLQEQDGRGALERLSLRLAVGAATERVYVSFPRLDAAGGRARVPSFYALELMRAVTGAVPDHVQLAERAAAVSEAPLAWPAPRAAVDAIDDFEHDLSVLRSLMDAPTPSKGHAQYLVQLNAHLRRSLTSQWNRARSAWTAADGVVRVTDVLRPFLATQRMSARPYSVSALQNYAACPYKFLLSAIYRFAPIEIPAPLQHLDPLTRGSLFHAVQAEVFRALDRESLIPPRKDARPRILQTLERTVDTVADEYAERLAPAIDRVWRDEIAAMKRDLYVWIDQVMNEEGWEPWRFELAFGLPELAGRDEHSFPDPVTIDGRFTMRGSIDLVERKPGTNILRVTDYKTSRNRSPRHSVVTGGTLLQPVLYSLAVEAATGLRAESGRFWYCTSAGGFSQHVVAMNDRARNLGLEVLTIIDRALELGTFPAAPAERQCDFCDFRPVCGPDLPRRIRRKSPDLLGDLKSLRELP
jgi:ATP-dependent helicase/nuclease subunit B